jgi:putative transposase
LFNAFDASGAVYELAAGDVTRLVRLCRHLDELESRLHGAGVRHHQRWRMRKAATRIRRRVRHLVDEVHCKLARFFCASFDVVLIPLFETQRMVRKAHRRIRSKTARSMLTWSHHRFRMRLIAKAREYPHCKVIVVDEAHTSKTCGSCGNIHQRLGGNKLFKCPRCGLVCDRDKHAARNIMLRYLTTTSAGSSAC